MPVNWKAEELSAPSPASEHSLITSEKLKQLYAMMLKLRIVNEHFVPSTAAHRKTFRLEACEVGCTIDLREQDLIVSLPYQHIAYLARMKPADFVRRRSQRRRGPSIHNPQELALSLNILDVQNARMSLATGASLAYKLQHTDYIVVAFCAPSEVIRSQDSIYFATLHSLPIVYVQVGDESAKSRKTKPRLNYPSITAIPVEQNDVVAIYRVASEAIDKARRGVGPTVIQCVNGYSSSKTNRFAANESGNPLPYMEHYLRKKNLWSTDLKETIQENFSRVLMEGFGVRSRSSQ